jgi:hypothetical protein
MVVETLSGLFFLNLGLRLWSYHILPVWYDLTSPLVWLLAGLLIVPIEQLFRLSWRKRFGTDARFQVRFAFLTLTGCVLEVAINEIGFNAFLGERFYSYEFLPTFGGSGSVLSPLYYATLVVHWPITDYILQRANSTRPLANPNQTPARNWQTLGSPSD